jgi:hypothetical protein
VTVQAPAGRWQHPRQHPDRPLFTNASGSGAGGVVAHGTAARAPDGSCDPLVPTLHEVDRISSTGTLSY